MKLLAPFFLCAVALSPFVTPLVAGTESSSPDSAGKTVPEASFTTFWNGVCQDLNRAECPFEKRKERIENYVSALYLRSQKWELRPEIQREGAVLLAQAYNAYLSKEGSTGLELCEQVLKSFPTNLFAAEALYLRGSIYKDRHQFEEAYREFKRIQDLYPNSDRIGDALTQIYLLARGVQEGLRPRKFGGRMPWLKDRNYALRMYGEAYEMASGAAIAPYLLYQSGILAVALSEEWLGNGSKQKEDAIEAFEKLISMHPDSSLVPDAYLNLAGTYESLSIGPEWDQVSSRRALNYYTDFYTLFPEHEKADFAYERTEFLQNQIARNRLYLGDYFYSTHNNMRGAVGFYREAMTYAPDSEVGEIAAGKVERIRAGERAPRTVVDWLFGRYPSSGAVDFLDQPSQKSLEHMGFLKDERKGEAKGEGVPDSGKDPDLGEG